MLSLFVAAGGIFVEVDGEERFVSPYETSISGKEPKYLRILAAILSL